jgi:hypothetical protein
MAGNNSAALIYIRNLTENGAVVEVGVVIISQKTLSIDLVPVPAWLSAIQRGQAMIGEIQGLKGILDAMYVVRHAPDIIPEGAWLPKWEYFVDPWSPRQIYEFEADYALRKATVNLPMVLPSVEAAPTGGSLVFSFVVLLTYVRVDIPLEPDIPSPEEYAAALLFPDGCRLYNPKAEHWVRNVFMIAYRNFSLYTAGMIGEFFWVFNTDDFPAWHFIHEPFGTIVTPMQPWEGQYITDYFDDWNTGGSAAGYSADFLPAAESGFQMYTASGYDWLGSQAPGHWIADIPVIVSKGGVPQKQAEESGGGGTGSIIPPSQPLRYGLDTFGGINLGRIFADRMKGIPSTMQIGGEPVEIGGETIGG